MPRRARHWRGVTAEPNIKKLSMVLACRDHARYDTNICSLPEEKIAEPVAHLPVDAAALLAVLRETPTIELESTFREMDTLHNASGAYRLMLIAVLDEREVGREDGARDTTDWLIWSARVAQARARGLVETARALRDRPEIATTAMEGRFSGDQLEAVVTLATPETDAQWAEDGPGWTAAALRTKANSSAPLPPRRRSSATHIGG